jgi:L-fuconate dehydratase
LRLAGRERCEPIPISYRLLPRVISLDVKDIRFPTSRELDGSDAMNRDPDYSAAYVTLVTDGGPDGHGFAFTIGRGNEVQAAAIRALAPHVVGREVEGLCADLGGFYLELVGDSQLRWLGPEKGAMHMAIGAVARSYRADDRQHIDQQ